MGTDELKDFERSLLALHNAEGELLPRRPATYKRWIEWKMYLAKASLPETARASFEKYSRAAVSLVLLELRSKQKPNKSRFRKIEKHYADVAVEYRAKLKEELSE